MKQDSVAEVKSDDQIRTGDSNNNPLGDHDQQNARTPETTAPDLGPDRDRDTSPGRMDLSHGVRSEAAGRPGSGDGESVENSVERVKAEGGKPAINSSIAPKRANTRKPRQKKVLDFTALKGAKDREKKKNQQLPPRGQESENWLKSILPPTVSGAWWETPADDKGFKIKLRWRVGGKKQECRFARLGKIELETLKEKSYDEQCRILGDRIRGQILRDGRRDAAIRLAPAPRNNQVAGGEAS
jgi:hypothetical protein